MPTRTSEAATRPPRLLRLLLAATAILVPLWVLATRWDVVLAGHPAYLVLVLVVAAMGVGLAMTALRARPRRGGVWVAIAGGLGVLFVMLLVGATAWLRPFAAAPEAIDVMSGTEGVAVTDSTRTITLTPVDSEATVGVVVQPGARVDPRAYVRLWERIGAQGYLVVIVKQPLNIGFLSIGAPIAIQAEHPEIEHWVLSGHSLGGVAAAQFVAGNPGGADGIVFWASYPLDSLADREDLVVASISGSADGLSTPDDIQASRSDLPDDATFTEIQGGTHAFFGDYGDQPGDGTPATRRADAQDEIVAATLAALASVG